MKMELNQESSTTSSSSTSSSNSPAFSISPLTPIPHISPNSNKSTTCTLSQDKAPPRRPRGETTEQKRARKAAARAKRDPDLARKPCDKCNALCDVLVRCRPTNQSPWMLLCPGKCWNQITAGVPDGNLNAQKLGYVYGGMWKNWKKDGISAKMPNSAKRRLNQNNHTSSDHSS